MERREFLKSAAALATASAVGLPAAAAHAEDKPMVKRYGQLGKTGLSISDISFGAGKLPGSGMILRAVDRGINYIDTAPDYGNSEDLIGEAMVKLKGQRDKLILASKFCQYTSFPGHLPLNATAQDYVSAVEESLTRLKTDYLDVVFVHALGSERELEINKKRILNDELLSAVEKLKKDGKMRFLAASSHGPHNLEQVMEVAVDSGHYDVIMPAFNFMKFPRIPEVLKKAHAKGVGVVAMKTLAGAKEMALDPGQVPFEHAAFRFVLKHPEVAGLVITIKSVGDLDHFLRASGSDFTAADQRALDRYAALYGADYCRTGCDDCEPSCPQELEIAEILRYQMYFEDYGEEKKGMEGYASLEKNAFVCLDCADAACAGACPYGLPVAAKLKAAHRALSFLA